MIKIPLVFFHWFLLTSPCGPPSWGAFAKKMKIVYSFSFFFFQTYDKIYKIDFIKLKFWKLQQRKYLLSMPGYRLKRLCVSVCGCLLQNNKPRSKSRFLSFQKLWKARYIVSCQAAFRFAWKFLKCLTVISAIYKTYFFRSTMEVFSKATIRQCH